VRRTGQLKEQGIFCGLQTGGVLHAALSALRDSDVTGDVIIISGDTGWKNMAKLLSL
jgi:cysteine synthase